jgi:dCTP deaminase
MFDDPWASLGPGTLVDSDIQALVAAGHLITEGFTAAGVKQACYELRASDTFYNTRAPEEERRIVVDPTKGFVLLPHTYVTCIVQESIVLPAHVVARILTKGQLFSVGILPVNTYADPGFQGQLGITLCNMSHRSVVIRPGEPIAKIEFTVLPKPVQRPYHGQHGYATKIWPVPTHFFADRGLTSGPLGGYDVDEVRESYGPVVASIEDRLQQYSRRVWIQLLLIVGTFAALLAMSGKISLVVAIITGVAANAFTTLGVNMIKRHGST